MNRLLQGGNLRKFIPLVLLCFAIPGCGFVKNRTLATFTNGQKLSIRERAAGLFAEVKSSRLSLTGLDQKTRTISVERPGSFYQPYTPLGYDVRQKGDLVGVWRITRDQRRLLAVLRAPDASHQQYAFVIPKQEMEYGGERLGLRLHREVASAKPDGDRGAIQLLLESLRDSGRPSDSAANFDRYVLSYYPDNYRYTKREEPFGCGETIARLTGGCLLEDPLEDFDFQIFARYSDEKRTWVVNRKTNKTIGGADLASCTAYTEEGCGVDYSGNLEEFKITTTPKEAGVASFRPYP